MKIYVGAGDIGHGKVSINLNLVDADVVPSEFNKLSQQEKLSVLWGRLATQGRAFDAVEGALKKAAVALHGMLGEDGLELADEDLEALEQLGDRISEVCGRNGGLGAILRAEKADQKGRAADTRGAGVVAKLQAAYDSIRKGKAH